MRPSPPSRLGYCPAPRLLLINLSAACEKARAPCDAVLLPGQLAVELIISSVISRSVTYLHVQPFLTV